MKVPLSDLYNQYYSIKNELDTTIENVINDSAFINGKYVDIFEKEFAKIIGTKHCIGVGNGTDALSISLRALGIGLGDEVITAANTFIATSEAISITGARVVFVDCDPITFNIDPAKIQDKINTKTKAIIPVHLYGQPAEMSVISEVARENNLVVIEDASQAHLAEYRTDKGWKKVGRLGMLGTFSFYPGKNLGAFGDAGAIVTNNDQAAQFARMYSNHGRLEKYNHEFEGINSRMDGMQAAILNAKMKYLEIWNQNRVSAANLYLENLKSCTDIILPACIDNARHVYHQFVIRVPDRDNLREYLNGNGIATGIHYPVALPFLKAYRHLNHNRGDFPVAFKCQNEILSLPVFPEITNKQINYVCEKILSYFN